MYPTKVYFEMTKTVQEVRFEPVKMTVGIEYNVNAGDEIGPLMEQARNDVQRELSKAFTARRQLRENSAQRLEELKKKREQLDKVIANGGNSYVDEEEFWDGIPPADIG